VTQFSEPDAGFDRLLESPSSPEALGSAAFPRLEALLAAAAAVEAGPQPGEQVVLAAFRELVTEAAGTPSLESRRKAKHARQRMYALVAATSGVVLLSSGVAAAKTGALPGAAQSTAKSVLGVLGVHVPGPNAHAGNHPNQRGNSGAHSQAPSTPPSPGSPDVTPPVHPTPPAQAGTPPTPGNSGVSRHHGNPTPTASGHPTPGHGKPAAAPTVAHRHATPTQPTRPTLPAAAVTHRSTRAMSR
jgi:hypothetical protein